MIIIQLLAIYGLYFFLSNSDGPFGIMSLIRNKLMLNKYLGTFFYKLFDCPFCCGIHVGYIIYLLTTNVKEWSFYNLIAWAFAGGALCYILTIVLENASKNQ